ncbi:MAG: hypothetical protein MR017_06860 [Paraprevotella sp.]|nr:hypothetical protein [Paraprevotella sp.]
MLRLTIQPNMTLIWASYDSHFSQTQPSFGHVTTHISAKHNPHLGMLRLAIQPNTTLIWACYDSQFSQTQSSFGQVTTCNSAKHDPHLGMLRLAIQPNTTLIWACYDLQLSPKWLLKMHVKIVKQAAVNKSKNSC